MSETITRTMEYRSLVAEQLADEIRVHRENGDMSTTECRHFIRARDLLSEDYAEAVSMNAAFSALPTGALAGLATSAAPIAVTSEADTQAALRQAELLGATADQRRKLRGIVEEAQAAKRAAEQAIAEVEVHRAQAAQLQEELTAERQRRADAVALADRAQTELNSTGAITDPADRRVWEIFGKAAAEADKQGYCSVYDQISKAVGIPDRDTLKEAGFVPQRSWDVRTSVTVTFDVVVTVEADSESNAIESVDYMGMGDFWEIAEDQLKTFEIDNRYQIDSKDAREAEVVED